MDASDYWWILAVLAPSLMAIASLMDSCLVGNNIYKSPLDGTMMTCLLSLLPVIWILLVQPSMPATDDLIAVNLWSAVAASLAYVVHLIFYFRTLAKLNDVSGAETFIALSVLIVPFFAWVLLGEVLSARYYLMFVIAAAGVLIQCWPLLRRLGPALLFDMSVSVIAVSLAMVLQAYALEKNGFEASILVFNSSCFFTAILLLLSNRQLRVRVVRIVRQVPFLLLTAECIGLLALVCSHGATELGPSVSLVALIECLLPALIILLSLMLLGMNRLIPMLSGANSLMLNQQVAGLPAKLLALTLLFFSVSMLSL